MYKYEIGSTIKAIAEVNVIDAKKGDGHTHTIEKEVIGKVIDSSSILAGGRLELWYTIKDDKDIIYRVKEIDIMEVM